MAALGVSYSDRMDEKVLPVVGDICSITYPTYERDTASGIEDENIKERLVDLGYL
jgi:hypothetical protein